jgi:hypothetical protein
MQKLAARGKSQSGPSNGPFLIRTPTSLLNTCDTANGAGSDWACLDVPDFAERLGRGIGLFFKLAEYRQ